jgi:branched-chain amino acid transport system permease protein
MIEFFQRYKRIVLAIILVMLIAVPTLMSGYMMRFATLIFMYVVLSLSWDLLGGQTGYPSFGNPTYFGVSAYVTAVFMTKLGLPFAPAFLLAGLASALLAFLLGLPLLRLKGHSFAISTFCIMIVAYELASNIKYVGGSSGIEMPIFLNYYFFYYAYLGLAFLCILSYRKITTSKLGVGLNAIREDEEKAAMLGIKTTVFKTFAWMIAAFFTGLCGSLYAYWFNYIEPHSAFDMNLGVLMILMALLGGSGTILGPVIGAFILEILIETIWNYFLGYHLIIIGLIIMIVVRYVPEGIVGFYKKRKTAKEVPAGAEYKRKGEAI